LHLELVFKVDFAYIEYASSTAVTLLAKIRIELEEEFLIFEEIIWMSHIVDKLAWKHRVVPAEVEEVLAARVTRHFRNQRGKIDGEDVYNALGKTDGGRYLSVFLY
jgi:hypothetical protein